MSVKRRDAGNLASASRGRGRGGTMPPAPTDTPSRTQDEPTDTPTDPEAEPTGVEQSESTALPSTDTPSASGPAPPPQSAPSTRRPGAAAPGAQASRPEPARRGRRTQRRHHSAKSQRLQVGLNLTPQLRHQLAEAAYRERVPQTQLLLEAIDAHPNPNPDDPSDHEPGDGRLAPPRRPEQPEGRMYVNLKMDAARLERVDELADAAGMTRSEFARAVLAAYFDQRGHPTA